MRSGTRVKVIPFQNLFLSTVRKIQFAISAVLVCKLRSSWANSMVGIFLKSAYQNYPVYQFPCFYHLSELVREIQGQERILEYFVREIWNFVESQGNLRIVREI